MGGVLPSGCKALDVLMNGGLPLKAPSLVFGMPNLGKTWLAFQFSCMCTRDPSNGGLGRPVLYLDTESFFANEEVFNRFYGYFRKRWSDLPAKPEIHAEMVEDIFALGKKFGIQYTIVQEESRVSAIAKFPKKTLEKEVKETTQTSDWLKSSPIWQDCEKNNYGLIVIDSITVPIKSVIPKGTQHLPGRGTLITSLLGTLYPIAKNFNCAILVTDHITRNPMSPGYVYGVGDPWGGQDITYYIKYQFGLYMATKDEREKYGDTEGRLRRVERHRYPGFERTLTTVKLEKDYGYTDVQAGKKPA